MIQKINNCYDSHIHFWATGQVASGLRLDQLQDAEDIHKIKIEKNHYRANWITGFGWNQNNWTEKKFPDKKILDQVFPDTPVFFSRSDGHASWVNSAGIREFQKLGMNFNHDPKGGLISRLSNQEPSGVLFDQAHINALLKLPDFEQSQHLQFLKISQKIFNQAGFTHLRDMSMNLNLWQILRLMEDQKDLTIALEAFVTCESLDDLQIQLNEVKKILQDPSKQMKLMGIKIFIDGSLGSQTAYLSENYQGQNSRGLLIWKQSEIEELLRQVWANNLQVAIHTIGDEAVRTAVMAARSVSSEGILGRLHLEHVQILSAETVQMMKPLHVTCHLQPCHWLSDHSWIKNSISETLVSQLFQWELLRKNKIQFYFGSDSPIEKPSLLDNFKALQDSADWGVPRLNSDWKSYHTHPNQNWNAAVTEFDQHQIKQVYFNGQALI